MKKNIALLLLFFTSLYSMENSPKKPLPPKEKKAYKLPLPHGQYFLTMQPNQTANKQPTNNKPRSEWKNFPL